MGSRRKVTMQSQKSDHETLTEFDSPSVTGPREERPPSNPDHSPLNSHRGRQLGSSRQKTGRPHAKDGPPPPLDEPTGSVTRSSETTSEVQELKSEVVRDSDCQLVPETVAGYRSVDEKLLLSLHPAVNQQLTEQSECTERPHEDMEESCSDSLVEDGKLQSDPEVCTAAERTTDTVSSSAKQEQKDSLNGSDTEAAQPAGEEDSGPADIGTHLQPGQTGTRQDVFSQAHVSEGSPPSNAEEPQVRNTVDSLLQVHEGQEAADSERSAEAVHGALGRSESSETENTPESADEQTHTIRSVQDGRRPQKIGGQNVQGDVAESIHGAPGDNDPPGTAGKETEKQDQQRVGMSDFRSLNVCPRGCVDQLTTNQSNLSEAMNEPPTVESNERDEEEPSPGQDADRWRSLPSGTAEAESAVSPQTTNTETGYKQTSTEDLSKREEHLNLAEVKGEQQSEEEAGDKQQMKPVATHELNQTVGSSREELATLQSEQSALEPQGVSTHDDDKTTVTDREQEMKKQTNSDMREVTEEDSVQRKGSISQNVPHSVSTHHLLSPQREEPNSFHQIAGNSAQLSEERTLLEEDVDHQDPTDCQTEEPEASIDRSQQEDGHGDDDGKYKQKKRKIGSSRRSRMNRNQSHTQTGENSFTVNNGETEAVAPTVTSHRSLTQHASQSAVHEPQHEAHAEGRPALDAVGPPQVPEATERSFSVDHTAPPSAETFDGRTRNTEPEASDQEGTRSHDEGAVSGRSEGLKTSSPTSRRRTMGSRKGWGGVDGETAEGATDAGGVKSKDMNPKDPKVKGQDHGAAGGDRLHSSKDTELHPTQTLQETDASPRHEAPPQSASPWRRRKMGSHRMSRGLQTHDADPDEGACRQDNSSEARRANVTVRGSD